MKNMDIGGGDFQMTTLVETAILHIVMNLQSLTVLDHVPKVQIAHFTLIRLILYVTYSRVCGLTIYHVETKNAQILVNLDLKEIVGQMLKTSLRLATAVHGGKAIMTVYMEESMRNVENAIVVRS